MIEKLLGRMSPGGVGAARNGASYRPAIDGYRGLFVLLVIAYHFGVTVLVGGWVGINHFFVFSGYLIARLLIKERYRTGTIWTRRFYLRRMRRVLPAMCVLVTTVLIWLAANPDAPRRRFAGDSVATLTFWLNWRLIGRNDQYFDHFDAPTPLRHAWTLSVEEQFYLVVPWLILALFAVTRRRMVRFWIVAAGATLSTLWSWHLLNTPDITSSRLYYGTDVRMQALLVGVAAAFLFTKRSGSALRLSRPAAEAFGWVGTAISIAAFFVLSQDSSRSFGNGLVLFFAVAAAAMGVSATDPRDLLINRIFSWRPLVFLGQISYGIYLYHFPISLWLPLDGWPPALGLAAKFVLTIALAAVSFRFLEYPVMMHGFRSLVPIRSVRRFAGGALFAALTAVALAMSASLADPGTARYSGPPLDPTQGFRAPSPPIRVALIGDSIPASLQEGFDPGRYPGYELLGLARAEGCDATPVTIGLDDAVVPEGPGCAAWRRAWPAQVRERKPDVVMATAGLRFLVPLVIDGKQEPMGSEASKRFLRRNLDALLAQFKQTGARQLQVINIPCRLLTPQQAVPAYRDLVGERPRPVDSSWANRVIADWATQHRAEGVAVLDLDGQLCKNGYRATINGAQLYTDGAHFTPAGAGLVWTWLAGESLRSARPSVG